MPRRSELKTLYQHLLKMGGERKLGEILRDFYRRMSTDLIIGFFFDGKNTDVIAERQKQFLLHAMSAKPKYSGKPPSKAHDSIAPILPGHFDRRLRILAETLRDHGLSDEDMRTWMEFEKAFRKAIVEK